MAYGFKCTKCTLEGNGITLKDDRDMAVIKHMAYNSGHQVDLYEDVHTARLGHDPRKCVYSMADCIDCAYVAKEIGC